MSDQRAIYSDDLLQGTGGVLLTTTYSNVFSVHGICFQRIFQFLMTAPCEPSKKFKDSMELIRELSRRSSSEVEFKARKLINCLRHGKKESVYLTEAEAIQLSKGLIRGLEKDPSTKVRFHLSPAPDGPDGKSYIVSAYQGHSNGGGKEFLRPLPKSVRYVLHKTSLDSMRSILMHGFDSTRPFNGVLNPDSLGRESDWATVYVVVEITDANRHLFQISADGHTVVGPKQFSAEHFIGYITVDDARLSWNHQKEQEKLDKELNVLRYLANTIFGNAILGNTIFGNTILG